MACVIYRDFVVAMFLEGALHLVDIFHFYRDCLWVLGLNPSSLIFIHVIRHLVLPNFFVLLLSDVVLELLSLLFRVTHASNKVAVSIHDVTESFIFLFQRLYFLNFKVILQLQFGRDIFRITFLLQEVVMDSIFVKTKNSSFD